MFGDVLMSRNEAGNRMCLMKDDDAFSKERMASEIANV